MTRLHVLVQIAEERALAGLCGNPRCAHHLQSQKQGPHYKIQGRVVYDLEDESKCTCRYVTLHMELHRTSLDP